MSMMSNKHVKSSGFTLIEAMVALLVFSVGLLGIAGLQTSALRNSTSAYWQSQATWFAYDIADRMRANAGGATAGEYDALDTASPPTDPGCIATAGCNTTLQVANSDAAEWAQQFATLPSGRGMLAYDAANNQYTITVMWDDARTGATGTGCDPTKPDVDLLCMRMTVDI